MEEKEEEICSQPLVSGWEPIHFQPQQQQQPSSSQPHSREWEIVDDRVSAEDDDDDEEEDFSIFPPSNHEGLLIQPQTQTHPHQVEQQEEEEDGAPVLQTPLPSPLGVDRGSSDRQRFDSLLSVARDLVINKLNSGIEGISRMGSFARSWIARRGGNESVLYGTGFTVALMVSIWYLKWQRWRRQSREEKIDHLILLVTQQDQKISLLMDHISRLNEVLSSRRRIPIFCGG